VLSLHYLATTTTGHTFVVSIIEANPNAAIPDASTIGLLATVNGALTLAAGRPTVGHVRAGSTCIP
jgi:hypothetical protein